MCSKLNLKHPDHFTTWWQPEEQRPQASIGTLFELKEHCWIWQECWTLTAQVIWSRQGPPVLTVHRNTKSTSTHSRLYPSLFLVSLVRKTSEMHPWISNAIFGTSACTCDIISIKMMWCSSGTHLQLHCVKIWSYSNKPFLSYGQFCTSPIAVAVAVQKHTAKNVYLFIYFIWYTTHGLLSASTHTTPYLQLGCKWPDVRVLPIQVPAWDLDLNLQDQGWGKSWLFNSASWTKRAVPPWTDGYQQMKHTRMTPRSYWTT